MKPRNQKSFYKLGCILSCNLLYFRSKEPEGYKELTHELLKQAEEGLNYLELDINTLFEYIKLDKLRLVCTEGGYIKLTVLGSCFLKYWDLGLKG